MAAVRARVAGWLRKTRRVLRRGLPRARRQAPPRPPARTRPDLFSDPGYLARARSEYLRQDPSGILREQARAGRAGREEYARTVPGSPGATRDQPYVYDTPQGRFRSDERLTGDELRQMADEVGRAREAWGRGHEGPYRSQYVNGARQPSPHDRDAPPRGRNRNR